MAYVSTVYADDRRGNAEVDALLAAEGIRRDGNLDYTCGLYDEGDDALVATGSCFGNTLRCMAVDHRRQGEGLLNTLATHLLDVQYERGNSGVFLYTKCESARYFRDLGFQEIARVPDLLVFMENRRGGFDECVRRFQAETAASRAAAAISGERVAAIVMNANPFTRGHLHLVETAARDNDVLHLFVVSEDASLFPFAVRWQLVTAGVAHLPNVICHASGPYIISNATFPSYFQKDSEAVSRSHALLDLAVFARIAAALGVRRRYVGEEPKSAVTSLYNAIMREELPRAGVECVVVPRLEYAGEPISASTVRRWLQTADRALDISKSLLAHLLPRSTLRFLQSEVARPVLERIRRAKNVVHH